MINDVFDHSPDYFPYNHTLHTFIEDMDKFTGDGMRVTKSDLRGVLFMEEVERREDLERIVSEVDVLGACRHLVVLALEKNRSIIDEFEYIYEFLKEELEEGLEYSNGGDYYYFCDTLYSQLD